MHEVVLQAYHLPLVRDAGFMVDTKGIQIHPNRKMEHTHVFIYVRKGAIFVVEDEKEYKLSEGTYLFLRKNTSHWGSKPYAPDTEWFYIHFYDAPNEPDKKSMQEYSSFQQASMIHEDTYNTILTLPKFDKPTQPEYIELQLQKILDRYHASSPIRPLQLSTMTYELFLELYQERKNKHENKNINRIVNKMIELLKQTPTERINSKDIAVELGMNYSYLSHLFREQTGKSVTQFQNELVIEEAIRLFKNNTTYNVSEVSEILGFSNPFYFSRVFKKVTGISPSVYLNQNYRS
ncbi:AraC family transcriptional regulator [Aquibacillus koreensis]|uniref:AraC family transcriptional regulator n=1 Tax=Aquibacillus koreensis TaxID=279446 RepID=A0A9X3WKS8_9BACI|nr:AraC family transcriptional regulator [Aquibacillus koreensis]MCT2535982.1 AraC family transcriptional regulator [Aquibacillus koreensis]MDC3420438.1 AraC family transcriptional regulator [Aquibacillus koreensis]